MTDSEPPLNAEGEVILFDLKEECARSEHEREQCMWSFVDSMKARIPSSSFVHSVCYDKDIVKWLMMDEELQAAMEKAFERAIRNDIRHELPEKDEED